MRCGFVYVFVVFLAQVRAQFRFACDDDFCSTKVGPCPKTDCTNGRIVKKATECGCCDICIKSLEKGSPCKNQEFAAIPREECGHGLQCIDGFCGPAKTKCILDQMEYDSDQGIGELTTGRPRPKCDYFGFYEPVVCKPGMLCYCVDANGKRIFGTDSSNHNESMHCDCSRDYEALPRKLEQGKFLRCLPNGNYDPLQCTEDWCYCMTENDYLDGRPIAANTTLSDLKCYNYDRHKNDDDMLKSKCLREREALLKQLEEYREQDITVVGIDLPNCDLDGSYAPIRCKSDSCYCVKRNSLHYEEGYKVKRNSTEAKTMTCRCAREKEILREEQKTDRVAQIFAQYICGPNGNYLPVQCVGSVCFCVDEDGFQNSETVLRYEHTFLECYNEKYEIYLE